MSTVTAIDYRRTDLRTNVLENPYWLTSGEVVAVDAVAKAAQLFSFPVAGRVTIVLKAYIQVTTKFAGGTAAGTLGIGSLATDAITTGGNVTDVDQDEFITSGDVTWTTAGYYEVVTATGSDYEDAVKTGLHPAPAIIVGAATTVPCVCLYLTNVGTYTGGKCRVHLLVTDIPGK